jgi:ABC-type polysaccharide/polyol phosphate transport system ATPase subunit
VARAADSPPSEPSEPSEPFKRSEPSELSKTPAPPAGALVAARDLGVEFVLDRHQRPSTPALARLRRAGDRVWALHHVDLTFLPGEAVALVGRSGSGKTTLLRAIAGVVIADEGEIEVRGRVGALLSIDAGLTGTLSGRENAELMGVLAGLSRTAMRERLDDVRELAALEDAFERPVSTYSQGMRARLGFAVGQAAGASVIVLDEVHEALDHEFRTLVAGRARALTAAGGIVVAAGHDHGLLATFCDRAVHMEAGHVVTDGPFDEVVAGYRAHPGRE